MAREARGVPEVLDVGLAENRRGVGCHVVVSGPLADDADVLRARQHLKDDARDARDGVHRRGVADERLVRRAFSGDYRAVRALLDVVVAAEAHEHRRADAGVYRFRDEYLVALRPVRQLDARHSGYVLSPRAGAVDYLAALYRPLVRLDGLYLAALDAEARDFGELAEFNAEALRRLLEGEGREERVGVSVAVVVGEAERVVDRDAGADFLRALHVGEYLGLDAEAVLELDVLLELLPLLLLVGDEQVAALVEPRREAELFIELLEGVEAGERHAAVELEPPLSAYARAAASGRAGADGVLLNEHDVLAARLGEVVGRSRSDDASSYYDYIGCFREIHTSHLLIAVLGKEADLYRLHGRPDGAGRYVGDVASRRLRELAEYDVAAAAPLAGAHPDAEHPLELVELRVARGDPLAYFVYLNFFAAAYYVCLRHISTPPLSRVSRRIYPSGLRRLRRMSCPSTAPPRRAPRRPRAPSRRVRGT